MKLMEFKKVLEMLGVPVFYEEKNASCPYIIYRETQTSFDYASGVPSSSLTSVVFGLYTDNELDMKLLEMIKLLVKHKVTIRGIRYSYDPAAKVYSTIFEVVAKHTLDYTNGDVDYIGNV